MKIGSSLLATPIKLIDRGTRTTSILAAAIHQAPPDKIPAALSFVTDPVRNGWVLPALAVATPIIVSARHFTDRSRREEVWRVLNEIKDATFKDQKLDYEQHGRVTLFRHHKFTLRRWPCVGGWLMPYERSGFSTRKTSAIFCAPDDGECAEGVAGKAWSSREIKYVSGLPNLRAPGATDAQFANYGEQSFCSPSRLRKKPPQARSLMGIPVDVDNKRWGVIVIDCVKEGFDPKRAQKAFKPLASHLAGYLRGK